MDKNKKIHVFEMSNYVKPVIVESAHRKWVLNGQNNSFFQYIIDRYNGSPTNRKIIDRYKNLIYGQGIVVNGTTDIYEELNDIFPKREQKKCISDLKTFGQYDMQIIRAVGGKVAQIKHLPTNKLGMARAEEDGNIPGVYYSENWNNTTKFRPVFYPKFDALKNSLEVKSVRPYSAGKFYFSDPDYLSVLQYADTEEEISNFFINHIQNGLSFGYIINVNGGEAMTDEEKEEFNRLIDRKLTGTSNAGKFIISFNSGKEFDVTIVPLEVNDAHNQWEFLTGEARQQLITGHGAYAALFGIETSNGFTNNADELDVQSRLLQDFEITPYQDLFIDELAPILEINGLETDLTFIPLRETYKSTEETETTDVVDNTVDEEDNADIELSKQEVNIDMDALLSKGDTINYEDWDLVDDRKCEDVTLSETQLNTVFEFASVPSGDARKASEQDTSLFKIRYRYAGSLLPEREFCRKIVNSNKVFRAEDLENAGVVNAGFGAGGASTYNVFKYKGGVNCNHWWQRVILLKKGNKKISVNQAIKMILKLEPEDRADAKWDKNPPEVAQTASPSNNFWKLN